MKRRWLLEVSGRRCCLDAEWDMLATSRGKAWVDGVEVARWWPKVKWPGITATVPVYGATVTLVGLTGNFDIDLTRSPGVRSLDPPLPPDYTPAAAVQRARRVMALVIGLAVTVPLVGVGVLALLGYLGYLR